MKKIFLLQLIMIGFIQSLPAQNIHPGEAPHGGKIKPAGEYFIEFLLSSDSSYVYLLNKEMKPTNNLGIKGDIAFQQADSTISSSDLQPFGTNAFVVRTHIERYTACIIHFDIKGLKISARFDETESMAKKNKNLDK